MNRDEAKFHLQAGGEGRQTPADSELSKALEMAANDPELQQFMQEEAAFDAAFRAALNADITVPEGLREQIIANAPEAAHAEDFAQEENKVVRLPWFLQPLNIGLAAAIAIIFTITLLNRPTALPTGDNPVDFFVSHSTQIPGLAFEAPELVSVSGFLAEQNYPVPQTIPATLEGAETIGCLPIATDNGKASLICFKVKDGKIAHLYVSELETNQLWASAPQKPEPQIKCNGKNAAAAWTANGQGYVLTMEGEEKDVQDLL